VEPQVKRIGKYKSAGAPRQAPPPVVPDAACAAPLQAERLSQWNASAAERPCPKGHSSAAERPCRKGRISNAEWPGPKGDTSAAERPRPQVTSCCGGT